MIVTPPVGLADRHNAPAPRYTSYPPANRWSRKFGARALAKHLAIADHSQRALSLYVHLPFCEPMCRFCECNVIATRDRGRADGYLDTLALEIELWAAQLATRRRVSQLHLGGGTPTFLSAAQLLRLFALLVERFPIVDGADLAIEADPAVTDAEQLEVLAQLGFRRISIGVQDLDPGVQEAVGRLQTAEQTERAIRSARVAGFTSVNVDLMYGLPFQTPERFLHTVERIIAMRPNRRRLRARHIRRRC